MILEPQQDSLTPVDHACSLMIFQEPFKEVSEIHVISINSWTAPSIVELLRIHPSNPQN